MLDRDPRFGSRRAALVLVLLAAALFGDTTAAHGQSRDNRRHARDAGQHGAGAFDPARGDHHADRGGFDFAPPHGDSQPFGSPNQDPATLPQGDWPNRPHDDDPFAPPGRRHDPFVPDRNPPWQQPPAWRPIPGIGVPTPQNRVPLGPFVTRSAGGDYYLYEPPPETWSGPAPVVLYLHGADVAGDAERRRDYDRVLAHLASRGYIVIFPLYQRGAYVANPGSWEDNCAGALRNALAWLDAAGRVRPDRGRFAVAGHSLGGLLALRIANRAASDSSIPTARGVVLHDAAGFLFVPFLSLPPLNFLDPADAAEARRLLDAGRYDPRWLDDLRGINAGTLLVVITARETFDAELREHGDGDAIVFGNANAGGVWTRAWWNTPIRADLKRAFRVPGPHEGVTQDAYVEPYVRISDEALRAAFSGSPMGDVRPAGVTELGGFPTGPAEFVWDCDHPVVSGVLTLLGYPCPGDR